MCDYNLAQRGVTTGKGWRQAGCADFARSITRGFAAVGETGVAVCPRPGTELAFEDQVQYDRALSLSGKARVNYKVARFRQINMDLTARPPRRARIPWRPDRVCKASPPNMVVIGPEVIKLAWAPSTRGRKSLSTSSSRTAAGHVQELRA